MGISPHFPNHDVVVDIDPRLPQINCVYLFSSDWMIHTILRRVKLYHFRLFFFDYGAKLALHFAAIADEG